LAYGCSKDDFAKYMTLVIQVLKWQKFIFDKWKVDYSNLAVALEAKERNYKNILQGLKGVFTIRLFNKYSKNEENSIPEVHCYDLKSGEVDELLTLLEGIKFKYVSVDTKSIKAIKESNSREIYQARKKLEK
jgi:hypothetical protein